MDLDSGERGEENGEGTRGRGETRKHTRDLTYFIDMLDTGSGV